MSVFPSIKLKKYTVKIGSGLTPQGGETAYKDQGIPLIRSQNVLVNQLDLSDVAFIDNEQHEKMSGSKVLSGDVLLNITGASIGRSCIVPPNVDDANVNQHVCIIRLKKFIDGRLLSLFLNSWLGQKQIWSFQGGGSREALNFQQIGNFDIPFPPLPEQKAIADLLSTWDKAITLTEQLIQAKERRFKWLLRELISEPRNTRKDAKWKKVKIGSFLTESRILGANGRDAQKITVKLYGKGAIAKDEKRMGSKTTQYYVRKTGQFIYSKLDFLNGAFGIIPDELDGFESTLDLPTFDISDSVSKEWFLYYLIRPEYYTRQLGLAKGQRKARRVNPSEFLKSKIPFPPLEVQKQIAKNLSTARREINLLKQLAEKYKAQKRGLMQKMLTGVWRIKPEIIKQYMRE